MPLVQRHVVFSLGADVDHCVDACVQEKFVIARVKGSTSQPQPVSDLIKPAVLLDPLVDKADEGKHFIKQIVE
jgi:hypothetical protein